MSRQLRVEYPGAFYHITARGNAKQEIFLDDKDFKKFLQLLGKEIDQQRWNCYAYCLMNNHYHLLIETPEPNLVKGMTRLNGTYTQYFNNRHNRVGHLFQGRYKSIVVEKESYLLELCRYIVLNPVRAMLVGDPADWKWSSYRVTIKSEFNPDWIENNFILEQFSTNNDDAITMYKRFVKDGIGIEAPWNKLKGQIWLGQQEFIKEVQKYLNNTNPKEIPGTQLNPLRPSKEQIVNAVKELYKISEKQIIERKNKEAYKATVYLLRRTANMQIHEIASMFQISGSMVSKIQREIETTHTKPLKLARLLKKYKVQT